MRLWFFCCWNFLSIFDLSYIATVDYFYSSPLFLEFSYLIMLLLMLLFQMQPLFMFLRFCLWCLYFHIYHWFFLFHCFYLVFWNFAVFVFANLCLSFLLLSWCVTYIWYPNCLRFWQCSWCFRAILYWFFFYFLSRFINFVADLSLLSNSWAFRNGFVIVYDLRSCCWFFFFSYFCLCPWICCCVCFFTLIAYGLNSNFFYRSFIV